MDPSRIDRSSRILGADIETLLTLMLDRNKAGFSDAVVELGRHHPGLRQRVATAVWRFFRGVTPETIDLGDAASVVSIVVSLRTLSGKAAIQGWKDLYLNVLKEERFVPLLTMINAALSRPMRR